MRRPTQTPTSHHSLSRRRFLTQTAGAGAVALSWQPGSFAADDDPLPIIDTHQHLWDLNLFRPPWLSGAPEVIAKSHVTADYLRETAGLNVVKAIYMEIDVDPSQQMKEAQHVIGLSRSDQHPTVAAVVSGRPNSPAFAAYVRTLKQQPEIKGIRQVLQVDSTPQGFCLQPQYVKSMKLLGELGLSFDLCMRPTELADGARLAASCPDTRFIVDHCGNADPKAFMPANQRKTEPWHEAGQWKRDIDALAERDNVVCKISGIVARAPAGWQAEHLAPIVNHCLDQFGPDRVMFGGDWPVCKLGASFSEWVNSLKLVVAERPLDQQRKLLHDNAAAFYNV